MSFVTAEDLLAAFKDPHKKKEAQLLLSRFADYTKIKDIRDRNWYDSSLHYLAALNGWYDMVKELVTKYNCDPNFTTSGGWTLLHRACLNDDLVLVQYLTTSLRLNPLQKNQVGETPFDYTGEKTRQYLQRIIDSSIHGDKDILPLSQRPTTPPSKNIQPPASVGKQTTILGCDPKEATCDEGMSASDTDIIGTDPSKCYSATENTETSASIEQTVLSSCDNNQQFMSEMKDKIMKNLFQEVKFLHSRHAEKDEVKTSLNAEVQFDYWVPMEDLLHGATVVDEIVFNTHGDKEQEYHWTECGFSLLVPEGALSRTETCPVAVKALISGRFQFPKRFQLISALYAISPGRKFTKEVKITLQHCFLIERSEQLKRLCIVKAEPTEPGNPYIFKIIKGGCFKPGSQYCEVWLSDFSNVAAGYSSDNNENGDTPVSSDNESFENEEVSSDHGSSDEEALSQRQESGFEQTEDEGGSHLYRAHFFLQTISYNNWKFKLVAVKHLAVHIKYVTDKFKEDEVIESFKFRFLLDKNGAEEPVITLIFTEEENKRLPLGWFVKPLSLPCCIPKEDIDALGTQELRIQAHEEERVYPDLPMRKVSVFAEGGAASHMEYGVQVQGIQEKKTIYIVLQLNSGNDRHLVPVEHKPVAIPKIADQNPNSQIIDIKAVVSCIKEVFDKRFADLKGICESSLEAVTAEMFAAGLISESVKENQSYDAMMKEFHAGFVFMEELSEVEEHCKTFFGVFHKLGGPFLRAGNLIKKCALQKIWSTHNLSLSFD